LSHVLKCGGAKSPTTTWLLEIVFTARQLPRRYSFSQSRSRMGGTREFVLRFPQPNDHRQHTNQQHEPESSSAAVLPLRPSRW
jgi:hypothetical protein